MKRTLRSVQVALIAAVVPGVFACEEAALEAGTAKAPLAAAPAAPAKAAPRPSIQLPTTLFKVPLGDSPVQGSTGAKATVIVFSDFQCPFCQRLLATLAEVRKAYGDEVRIAFKHLPLKFHDRAMAAALAAEAAREQGKFWEMHDRIFAEQRALAPADFERHATALGLDLGRFRQALHSPELNGRIDADMQLAAKLGVRGTPTLFVNGRKVLGAQPFASFKAVLDAETARADEKLRAGMARGDLYRELIRGGREEAEAEAAAAPSGQGCGGGCGGAAAAAPEPKVHVVDPGSSPFRGPRDAPLTAVVFSDYQCPFCARVEQTITALEDAYPGKVRVVWKNFPLAFHVNARPAAAAALAAGAQGKFWEMHRAIFAHQGALDRPSLDRYAQEVGLDVSRFREDIEAREHAEAIEADLKLGASVGVKGTPAIFLNGRKIVGAQPLESFKKIADEELAKNGR
jgi:protein-disulfide isomerase